MKRLLVPMLLACACSGAAADLFRVSGVVVNAETGAPLARAQVAMTKVGTSALIASQVTGDDGCFAFELPQGSYVLDAGPRYALERYGRRKPEAGFGIAIITGPDLNTTGIKFRWFPTSGILGKIVDETGEPVEGALVQLIRSAIVGGQRLTSTFGWARSDDRGEYRFGRLLANTYYLVVTGKPWYSQPGGMETDTGLTTMAYRTVYYPGSLEIGGAAAIALKSGEEHRADFTMQAVPGTNLKVTYEDPRGLIGTISLLSPGLGSMDGFERSETLNPFAQTLTGIAPGRYLLRMSGARGKTSVSAVQTVDATGGDLEVKLVPVANPEISGTLQMKNGGVRPRGTILVTLVNPATQGAVISAAVRSDGSFAFAPVLPGKYRPVIRSVDGFFASDIRVEGADFHDGAMEVAPGASPVLQIVASDEIARVRGFVMRDEHPVEGMMVVLAPERENMKLPTQGFQTDSDGSFDYRSVPAGDYLLFAVDDNTFEYRNRPVIQPYLVGAKRIQVEAHQSYSENIPVTGGIGR